MSTTSRATEPGAGDTAAAQAKEQDVAQHTTWIPGTGAVLTGGLGMALLALGISISRPDVAVLGLPMVLGVAWGWFSRPRGAVRVSARTLPATAGRKPGEVRAAVTVAVPEHTSLIRLRIAAAGYRPAEVVIAGRAERSFEISIHTARTGIIEAFRIDYLATGHDEMVAGKSPPLPPMRFMVRPAVTPLRRLPLPFRLQGLVGPHTSRRVGEGVELHDIHEFTPGDRLRRIDWRTTMRLGAGTEELGELYVRRTLSSADATVVLVVDSRDDVGPDVGTWAGGAPTRMTESTSVDLARQAAASVAEHFLHRGDRVGLDDLGRRRRPVAPAAGSKHLERIHQRLARIAPEGAPAPRMRSPQLPSGAIAFIFSTFLDNEASAVAAVWRSHGHRVVAVDTMPKIYTSELNPYALAAYRLVRMERALRLADLRKQGIDVVHWVANPDGFGDGATPDHALMVAAAPRRGAR